MNKTTLALLTSVVYLQGAYAESSFTDALTGGKTSMDMNLRYESVEQGNALDDASAMTLRTRLGYTTGVYENFSGMIEFEDSRIVGGYDEYSVPPAGFNPGMYSVILDPETTELDQFFVKFQSGGFTSKIGRQVITYDNQRFIGHVGWRQDRQTFDAYRFDYAANDALTISYSYLTKRNRILAEAADVDSKDSLLNVAYKTPLGKLVGYAYLLEVDNNTDNALDTYGVSLTGATEGETRIKYRVEYATQTSEAGAAEFDADYMLLEGGTGVSSVNLTLGYEVLGSDSGNYGFATPLATLHKFNGMADLFLATPTGGLVDVYVTAATKLGGGKFIVSYHDFSADDSSGGIDDYGDEIDLVYVKKFSKHYVAGIKYATYSAGDALVDTDKLWVWTGLSF